MTARWMTLPDGRRLAWHEYGTSAGQPVFAMHGVGSSHRQIGLARDAAAAHGLRVIALDRPGYGDSSLHGDRRLLDAGDDLAGLADHLHLGPCPAIGVSAGGPFALAAAASHADRITGVVTLSCVGPGQRPNGGGASVPLTKVVFALGRRHPDVLRAALTGVVALGKRAPHAAVRCRRALLGEADRGVLARPDVWSLYEAEARHASASTASATAQDVRLITGDWGFDPARVGQPVHMIHGRADPQAPISQARRLAARLPRAHLDVVPGGHLAFVDHLEDAFAVAAASPTA